MTNEERDLIGKFIARVAGQPQSGGFASGSVPQGQASLPPLDKDADAFITQQFTQFPEARYRITQTALVQEAAFAEAGNRIRRLEWELEQTRAQMQQQQQQAPQRGGMFGGIFGGGQQQQPRPFQPTSAPPQPQYPPNYQPGMFQQQGGGSSFLGSALTTAAGVAGGMVVGNMLMNAFSGHGGGMGGGFGGGQMAQAGGSAFDGAGMSTTVSDPTAGFSGAAGYDAPVSDPFAGGGEQKGFDQGGFDQAGYDQGGGAWDQGGGGYDPGGFDDNA